MAETSTTTLTIRIDEKLKADLEQAAKAADQSVTDYVLRAVKARMAPQCPSCGRSEQFVSPAMSQAFTDFLAMLKKQHVQISITVQEGGERRVYTGELAYNVDQTAGMIFMNVKAPKGTRGGGALVPIPKGIITGWTEERGELEYFRRLLGLGYVDGNAWAFRGLALG
jgi:biotin synthase-related radical SAM superfamily protein